MPSANELKRQIGLRTATALVVGEVIAVDRFHNRRHSEIARLAALATGDGRIPERIPYNEVIYLESLRKKGSTLLKFADYQL